jgi:peroxiredoxin
MVTLRKSFAMLSLSIALFSCENVAESSVDPINNTNNSGSSSTNNSGNSSANNSGTATGNTDKTKDFTLTSDTNLKVSLSDYKDNVVVLFFFGNGCSSCRAVSPEIQKTFVDNYTNKKVQVLGLDTWDGNINSVRSFKSSANLTFPLLLQASSVAKTFETTYDRILVLDKKGEVHFKGTQLARNDLANAKKAVDEILAK